MSIDRTTIEKPWLIKEYVENKRSTRDLASEVGCGCYTIQKRLHELNIPVRKAWDWKAVDVSDEWLEEQYISKKRSSYDIAREMNTFPQTILHRLKKKGVKIRSAGEARSLLNLYGENNPSWNGGKSFEPYCHKFNFELKERIRNKDERKCILCGKSEILNGKRLSVHHIDGDKMQGCNDKKLNLCSLCVSCNSLKDTTEKEFLIITNMEVLI